MIFSEIKGAKFLAWKSSGVYFLTNLMSAETDTRFSKTENSDIAGAGFKQMGPNQFQLVHVLGYVMQSLIGMNCYE